MAVDDLGRVVKLSGVRMIFGADDPRPWSAASPVFDALPNADRVIIENAGHAPWAEQSDQARDAITEMLSRTTCDGTGS